MKNKIRAILIDDEDKALKSVQIRLEKYWSNQIEIVDMIQNPEEAIVSISGKEPNLIFLDIEMPRLNGFELLKKFKHPNFEIIFVTAYNNFAIQAIQQCAIGYIVKPIDDDDLNLAIKNAIHNIDLKTALIKNQTLIENLNQNNGHDFKIIIPTQKGFDFINTNEIIRCEGEQGYTKIILKDKIEKLSSYSIGKFVKMLENKNFCNVHRSHLINIKYISSFLNEGYVIMENKDKVPISKNMRENLFLKLGSEPI